MIPTGNVLLGFDYDSMVRFLEEGASYQSLIKNIANNDDRVLLFNNESNPNFISFEHSLTPKGEPGFKITFIDPKQEFEKRFLTGGLFKRIAGSAYNTEVKSLNDYFGKKRSQEVSKSISKFDKDFYNELAKKLEENNNLKEIYVVYGTGNNLKLWSGPHKTYFTNAEITPLSGGARKITLVLQSTMSTLFEREGAFNEIVDLNLAGMTMRCNGTSQEVILHNYPKNVYDVASYYKKFKKITDKLEEYRSEEQTTLRESGFEKFVDLIKNIDIHSIIVDSIRNYVQSATRNKNVIVLIPNINVACREYLTHLADTVRLDSKASIVADSAGGTGIGSMQSSLDNSLFPLTDKETLAKLEAFLCLVLTDFGLELQKTILGEEKKALPQSSINIFKAIENKPTAKEAFEDYFISTNFTGIITEASNKGLPKHTEKLIKIFDKIKEASKGNYSLELVILTESQLKVLDFWSKGNGKINPSDYPTFGGYDKFNEKTEAIIVGDKGLISQYLYGSVSIENKEKQIQTLTSESIAAKKEADLLLEKNLNPFQFQQQSLISFEQFQLSQERESISKQLKASTLDVIPLHPIDKIILLDKRYLQSIKSLLYTPITGAGSFGDISYLPDEFAYSDTKFSQEEKNKIRQQGIPVFRYNIQNPNILDINVKVSDTYTGMLKTGYSKVISRKASARVEALLPDGIGSFPITNKEDAILFLRKKQFSTGLGDEERNNIIKNMISKFDPQFVETFADTDPEKAAKAIVALLDTLEKVDHKQFIEIGQHKPSDPVSVLSEILYDMYQKTTDVTIKTLPTFHISKVANIINNPCIVLAQDVPILQQQKIENSVLNSFIGGFYFIVGFKHVIDSTSGMYSEFSLVRPVAGLGDLND